MLVLTRKAGESFRIGQDVIITAQQIAGNRVRIGITAPDHIAVVRCELDERDRQRDEEDARDAA